MNSGTKQSHNVTQRTTRQRDIFRRTVMERGYPPERGSQIRRASEVSCFHESSTITDCRSGSVRIIDRVDVFD